MPINVRVNTQLSSIPKIAKTLKGNKLSRALTRTTAKKVGKVVVREMKNLIASGKSPIEGRGAFPAYRGTYRKRIRKGKIPGKSLKVNLKLTNKFLPSLTHSVVQAGRGGFDVLIRFKASLSRKIERGLRDGSHNRSDKAPRPTIPDTKLGESFARKIKNEIIPIYVKGIENFLGSL